VAKSSGRGKQISRQLKLIRFRYSRRALTPPEEEKDRSLRRKRGIRLRGGEERETRACSMAQRGKKDEFVLVVGCKKRPLPGREKEGG